MGISIDDSILICAYNKPSDKDHTMMHKLMKISPDDEPMILIGDFNMHAALWDNAYENTTPNPITPGGNQLSKPEKGKKELCFSRQLRGGI